MLSTALADCVANHLSADVLMGRRKPPRCTGEVEAPTFTNTIVRALLHGAKMPYEEVVDKLPGVEIEQDFARTFRYLNEIVENEKLYRSQLNKLLFKFSYHLTDRLFY